MKKIKLTKGKFAIVDDEDYNFLKRFSWHFAYTDTDNNRFGSVVTMIKNTKNKCITIPMAEFLIPAKKRGILFRLFHINGNLLDYRKQNIKYERVGVIKHNAPKNKNKTSKFKGVYFDKEFSVYRAYITKNRNRYWLGRFDTEKKAGLAYNKKAKELFGDYAYQNKID